MPVRRCLFAVSTISPTTPWSTAMPGTTWLTRAPATRSAGSADVYGTTGRPPSASIDFVTERCGFPLQDLVGDEQKHNEGNGEENRGGTDGNHAWNCGVEGPTDDVDISELRERQKR